LTFAPHLADLRSLAIDWLCSQGYTPVYIYFQREYRSIQTPSYVRKSLVGQLLGADISNPPDASLLQALETAKQLSRSPDFASIFTASCTKFQNLFGKVVVLFDAFDECEPNEQVTIAGLIETFNTSGVQTYVTTRPQYISALPGRDTRHLKIAARDEDIKNYIHQEIKRRKIKLNLKSEEGIVDRISQGVEGM